MKNIVIFEKLNAVQAYKVRYSIYLTLVPIFSAAILIVQLLIFSMLNLYYLEGTGLIIDTRIREAYYDQVIAEIATVSGSLALIIVASFFLSMIVLNWAVTPFTSAEKLIRGFKPGGPVPDLKSGWSSESRSLDRGVHAFLKEMATGEPQKEFQRRNPGFKANLPFLVKFTAIYTILSVLIGYSLGLLLNGAFNKIISLALNLFHGQFVRGHFFTAQDEVLTLGVIVSVVVSAFVYILIGYNLSKYMSTMVMVFYRSFKEKRFPIHLRKSDIYQSLAEAINERATAKK